MGMVTATGSSSGDAAGARSTSTEPVRPDEALDTNRRERKKRETHDALEAAALRLFAEKGYDETTVEEIAEEADVAVRTFFRYFQSKQHVLFGDVAHDITGRLRAALDARPMSEPPVIAVGAALKSLGLNANDQERQILDRMRLLEKLPELTGRYLQIFQDLQEVIAEFAAQRVGSVPQSLYPQLIANAAIGAVKAALCVFEASPDGRSVDEIRTEAYELLTVALIRLPT